MSRWVLLLAKIFLLYVVAVSTSYAIEPNESAPTDSAFTDSADDDLSQLNLDSYSADDDLSQLNLDSHSADDDLSQLNLDSHSADDDLSQLNLDSHSADDDSSFDTPDDDSSLDLYLDVTLNGASAGLVHFYFRDEQLLAKASILQQLGFIVSQNNTEPIALNSLPDLKIDYDARVQTLKLIAPLSMLNLDATVLNTRTNKRPQPFASPGVLLNYNLYGSQTQNNAKSLSAYSELRAFNSLGVLSSTALTTANSPADSDNSSSDWNSRTVRLDTSWSKSFPDKLITVRAGDILTGALSWTRSTRLGGLQIGTNFDLQPYQSTTPLPRFFGSATLPSAVELYVNGLKQYDGDVPAGPFELNTAPSFSGAGTAQLVVTDVLGQSTTLEFSLYDTHRLLQPGLSDWSLEVGAVRENYGSQSFDYGRDIAASGTWRHGVSNRFSAETHAEVTNGLSNLGIGGTWLLGSAGGILFASLAGSESQNQVGTQYSTNYSWNNRRFNIGASVLGSSKDYRDVGSQYSSTPARRSSQVSTGYSTTSLGSFGVSYNQVTQSDEESAQFASAYWSKSFGRRLRMSANYNHDINDSTNNRVSLSASFSMDSNLSLSSSVQHTDNNMVISTDVSKSTPSSGGLGWHAQVLHSLDNSENNADSSSTGGVAELNYLGRYGQAQAGIRGNDGSYLSFASTRGALVKMSGGLFATRQINSGFAVVSTGDVPDVPVLLQNILIGTTNSQGLLLVSPLNAYQYNKISIDPMQLPADLRIDKVSFDVTPTDRAGILVAFGITPVRSASVILVDDTNQLLPIGSQVRQLTNTDVPSTVVGFDGEVYLDTLDEHNTLEVTSSSGDVCTVSFDYTKQGDEIPLIGPLICEKAQP